ncbi:MAG: GLPGLI family protein [Leadbetterella sp.]|nr:GLPGLI family protein [Leadbetterella sp.]
MKKTLISVFTGLLLAASAQAQTFEGVIKYNRVNDPSVTFANNPNADRMRAQFGNMAEQARKPIIFELTVKGNESVYKADSKQDPGENTMTFNGETRTFPRRLPKDETYYNLEDKTFKRYEEYAQQPFQVAGSVETIRWKVDPVSTKEILGYTCMKATATETEQRNFPVTEEGGKVTFKDTVVTTQIEAWFTDGIESNVGPDKYNGLPGLILEVVVNGGARSYTATNIEKKAITEADLKINSKGKKMTQEQLDKLKKEHQAEQMKNFRGRTVGGNMVIIGGGN